MPSGGAVLGTAFVEIRPDLSGFGSQVQQSMGDDLEQTAADGGGRAGRAWTDTFKGALAALGVQATLQGAMNFLSGSIGAAREAEHAVAGLGQVLDNMGQSDATQRMLDYASALSQTTAVSDETIIAAQTMLGTFAEVAGTAGVAGGAMDRATAAAVDLAAAGFGSVESNAVSLGKALQDPAGRLSSLTRQGINFTDQQAEMIAAMQASGDMAGAQAAILAEVERQVGGTGAATATEADKMSLAWGEAQEQLGTALMPTVQAFASLATGTLIPAVTRIVGAFSRVDDVLESVVGWLEENRDWMIPLTVAVAALTSGLIAQAAATVASKVAMIAAEVATKAWAVAQGLLNAVLNANPIMLIVAGIAALVAGVIWAYQNVDWFRAGVQAAWDGVKAAFDLLLGVIEGVWNWIKDNWQTLFTIITGPIGLAVRWVLDHWEQLKAGFLATWNAISGIVTGAVSTITGAIRSVVDFIVGLHQRMFDAARGLGSAIIDGIRNGLSAIGGFASDIGQAVWNAVKNAINGVIRMMNDAIPNSIGAGPLSLDLPDNPIPTLHSGGIVPGRAGSETLALLQAGEYVLTPEQMAARSTGVRLENVNIYEGVDLDLLVGRLGMAVAAGRF